MKKEITANMLKQDGKDLSLIQLLQRARKRENLNGETSRKLDEIEKRVENGEPIPEEEMQLFFEAVTGSSEHSARFDILRQKIEAYNAEQMSIQDERIVAGKDRSTLAKTEEELTKQLQLAASMGKTEEMKKLQERLDIIRNEGAKIQDPQKLEKRPQISQEERGTVYEELEAYGNELQKEIDDNTANYSITDIKKKTNDVRESDYINRMRKIREDRESEKLKGKDDMERG